MQCPQCQDWETSREMNRFVWKHLKWLVILKFSLAVIFHFLEVSCLLDSNSELNLFALQLFTENQCILWTIHRAVELLWDKLENANPQWHYGILALCIVWMMQYSEPESYGIDFESLSSVPESQLQLTEKDMTVLRNHVPDPLEDDRNSDNDLYIKFCETLKRVRYLPW